MGVAVNTIKAWLSVLEATFQIVLVRPYHRIMGKRLVKAPKLYFLDPGLAAYLVGLIEPRMLFLVLWAERCCGGRLLFIFHGIPQNLLDMIRQ